jgi:hypothetical protein
MAQDDTMNIKMLILTLWIFFLVVRNTGDIIWQFCLIYCGALVLCAFFYQLENKGAAPRKSRKKK